MSTLQLIFKTRPHGFALLLSLLLGPGAIAISGRDRWDGVVGSYLIESGHLDGLDDWLIDSGWLLLWLMMRGIAWLHSQSGLDYWTIAKAVLVPAFCAIGYEVYRLARDLFGFDRPLACWCAALTLVFPGYVLLHTSPHIGVAIFLWMALAGFRFSLRGSGWRVIGMVLMALSVQMNSNAMLLPALALARLWLLAPRHRREAWRHFGLLLLVVVGSFILLRASIGSMGGVYAQTEYNKIFWPVSWSNVARLAVSVAMWSTWVPMLLVGPAVWMLWSLLRGVDRRAAVNPQPATSVEPDALLMRRAGAALLLCAAAAIPYIAAGKFAAFLVPTLFGAGESVYANFMAEFVPGLVITGFPPAPIRHTIILGAVLSPAIVCAAQLAARHVRSAASTTTAVTAMLCIAWVHQAAWAFWAHREKLIQSALDQSIVLGLRAVPPPPAGALVVLQRQQRQKLWYDSMETNYLLYSAYGRAQWLAATTYAPEGWAHRKARDLVLENQAEIARNAAAGKDIRPYFIAGDYVPRPCDVHYTFAPVEPSATDLLWRMPLRPHAIQPARLLRHSQTCTPDAGISVR